MFSVLEYHQTSTDKQLVNVRHFTQLSSRGPHLACRACHSKKVKCSGQKDGCDRCRTKSLKCIYVKHNRKSLNGQAVPTTTNRLTEKPSHSNGENFAQVSPGASLHAGIKSDGVLQQMSNWLLDMEVEGSLEQPRSTSSQGSQPAAEEQIVWNQPIQMGEDEGGSREAQISLDSSSGNGVAHMDGDTEPSPDFELNRYDNFGGRHTVPTQEADAINLFSNFDYDTTTLTESSEALSWRLFNPTSTEDLDYSQSKITNGMKTSGRQVHATDSGTRSPVTSPTTVPVDPIISLSPCQCTHTALRVLETLQISNCKLAPSAFDRILCLKKQAIEKCTSITDCPNCLAVSPMVTLLIVICEKLVVSFESWSNRYNEKILARPQENADGDVGRERIQQIGILALGVYQVDVEEEKCSLLRALAMVQLRRLTHILSKLTNVARYQGWAGHRTILNSLVSRSETAASGLLERF